MWSITFIARAVATTLVRLPQICLHDLTNTFRAPRIVKTRTLLTIFFENYEHKIDFAKSKVFGTARNRTELFILENLGNDKLKSDTNVDQSSITLYLFKT